MLLIDLLTPEMCHHNTYMFSLCGHITISKQLVKNCKPCLNAQKSSAVIPETPVSIHARTTAFPSPHEFEFARQLHNSVPSSPASPDLIDAHIEEMSPERSEECNIIERHPLYTYVLPQLCHSCQQTRMRNIERFENQTQEERIRRLQTLKSGNGVVDQARKKIARSHAAKQKGELMQLICVEEVKLRKQAAAEIEAEAMLLDQATAVGSDIEYSKMAETVESAGVNNESRQISPSSLQVNGVNGEVSVRSQTPSATSTAGFSWASWWKKGEKSNSTAPAVVEVQHAIPPIVDVNPGHERKPSIEEASQKRIASRFSIDRGRAVSPRVDVPRDEAGRNVKTMNRIMAWGGSGG